MSTVNASEHVKTHIRWLWEAPDDADEQASAREAVAALFSVSEGWLQIAGIEVGLGLYDPERFSEADARPAEPFQLLRTPPAGVRIEPRYRSVETVAARLDQTAAMAWLLDLLAAMPRPQADHQPSLRTLDVRGSRVRLPGDQFPAQLDVECYAGEIAVPVDNGWVAAPAEPPGVPDPVQIRMSNLDGVLQLILEVFWSPWADAPALQQGLARLQARGWRVDR